MPIVSVIIPVHNAGQYLDQCLQNVANQTLRDIEIICVNDGSTDCSSAILMQYAQRDSRFVILDQQNLGAGAARNMGMSVAQGKYLSFLDADDYFEPTMLDLAYKKLQEDGAEIVVFGFNYHNMATNGIKQAAKILRKEWLPDVLPFSYKDMPIGFFNSFHSVAWNKLFKKSLVDAHSLRFQELFRSNDVLFTHSALALAQRITILNEPLVYHRRGIATNCQSTTYQYPYDSFTAISTLKKFLEDHGLYAELKQTYINFALDGSLHHLRTLEGTSAFREIFDFYKAQGFDNLGISECAEEYFYDNERYLQYKTIINNDIVSYSAILINNLKEKIEQMKFDHSEKIKSIKLKNAEKIEQMKLKQKEKVETLKLEHKEKIEALNLIQKEKIDQIRISNMGVSQRLLRSIKKLGIVRTLRASYQKIFTRNNKES